MPTSRTFPFFRTPRPLNLAAPLLVYLPGMDGTGELFSRQLAGLEHAFDIRCLAIPPDDLTGWDRLAEQIVELIHLELKQQAKRSIYLCGESFGGCLALKVMLKAPELFDRLILINPGSSFKRHPWIYWGSYLVNPLPEAVYRAACVSFLPFLAALGRMEVDDRRALLTAMQTVTQRSSIWRMSLLREFTISDAELAQIKQPTLLIASARDSLLPSVPEAERLLQVLPVAQIMKLPESGHACLLEFDINLYDLMQSANFLPSIEQTIEA